MVWLSQWCEFVSVLVVGTVVGIAIGYQYTQERWMESEIRADYYRRELAAERGDAPETLPPQNLPLTVEEARVQ